MSQMEIQEIVDRETRAWSEKSAELLFSIFHPDMVWVWPTDPKNGEHPQAKNLIGWAELVRPLSEHLKVGR